MKKKICVTSIFYILSVLLLMFTSAQSQSGKVFTTKGIKALENLINADGEVYFRSGDDGNAYIDSDLILNYDLTITGDFDITGTLTADEIGIGTTSALTADFEIVSTDGENIYIYRYGNNANPPGIKYWKARGTEAIPTRLSDADDTGKFEFWGYARNSGDTADAFVRTGMIIGEVDGVDAQNRIGGSLDFYTSSGVSVTPTLKYTVGNTYTEIQNITIATASTQYESWDQRLKCSVWDTTNTQAEDRIMYWTLNAGSGAHGSEPYYLSLYDNSDVEMLRVDPMHTSPAILFPDYVLHLGDVDTGIYLRDDRYTVYSGARTMIDAYETTDDYVYIGYDSSNDIDVKMGPDGCFSLDGGTKNIVMSGGNLDLGADDVISTLSIHDAGTVVMYDNSDDTTVTLGPVQDGSNTLDLTGSVEIKTTSTDSETSLAITPQDAISTLAAEYDGINIDGDALDPSVDNVLVHGVHIDFDDITPSGSAIRLEGLHIDMPVPDPTNFCACGMHLVNGYITQEPEASADAASTFSFYRMFMDTSNLDSTSDAHGFVLELSEPNPSGTVSGLAVFSEIDPIHHHIQAFSTPSQTEYAGRYTGSFTDGIDSQEIFVQDDDEVWFGSTSIFDAIEVMMTTGATRDCLCAFYYYNTGSSWVRFLPTDATNGFQNSGTIIFDSSGFTNWDAAGDPAGADGSSGYWMAIRRTVNADPGTPTITTLKTGTDTLYYWDENGDLAVNDIDAVDIVLGTASDTGTIEVHDAGTLMFYDDSDDTSVTIGPVQDGTTILDITGSISTSSNIYVTDNIYAAGDLNTVIDFDTDDTIRIAAGGACSITLEEASGVGTITYATELGGLKIKNLRTSLTDDGSRAIMTAASVVDSGRGWIAASNSGVIEAWADFLVGGDGNVILVANSAGNVSANADVDGDLCLGTAASQDPITIKNRLGGTRVIIVKIEYF